MQFRTVIFAVCTSAALLAQSDLAFRDALNQGVQLYKSARYQEAVAAFQRAAALDPENVNPHLYLATTYMRQWIPGAESADNAEFARKAEAEFQTVLNMEAGNRIALASLASLAFNQASSLKNASEKSLKLDEAERWNQQLIQADPSNREAYYSLGVIAWQRFYPELGTARARLGMLPDGAGPLTDFNARQDLRSRFGAVVNEGIRNLTRAIEIDPAYDDAMAYMSLLIRERADLRDTPEEYQQDAEIADNWVAKALDAKRMKGGASGQGPAAYTGKPRIRVGANMQAANLVNQVVPVYPPLAVAAGIQGVVRFNASIGKDGHITHLQLVSGHPILIPAATEAVKQWVYRPTLLNGEPVDVMTQIDVPFQVSQ